MKKYLIQFTPQLCRSKREFYIPGKIQLKKRFVLGHWNQSQGIKVNSRQSIYHQVIITSSNSIMEERYPLNTFNSIRKGTKKSRSLWIISDSTKVGSLKRSLISEHHKTFKQSLGQFMDVILQSTVHLISKTLFLLFSLNTG